MPINFGPSKLSPEKYRTGWVTTRFWLSAFAEATAALVAAWGGVHNEVVPLAAGALSGAIVAAVYVWAISREP